ncbi:MAG: hypothetical protein KGJ11_06095 [Candidatus Omnitrophica bacterium]|nr:hypothetical protein [Candidatus Omnitrophota bacterium]
MKRAFLFDASAVTHYYIHNPKFADVLAFLLSIKESEGANFFIPSFCVAETLNTFAKHHYRWNLLDADLYKKIREDFVDSVHNRKLFYSYDLNRYHNLNAEEIFPLEHTINTEFVFVDGEKPSGKTMADREKDLDRLQQKLKDQGVDFGKHYLSTFDVLLIAMAKELRRFFGESNTFIVTKDQRLSKICEEIRICKAIYLPATTIESLKARMKL